jgi:hypothetical protein
MDGGIPFVADGEAAEAIEPGLGPLRHPAEASQAFTGLDPLARNPAADAALPQTAPVLTGLIGLVRMELVRPLPRATARALDRLDGIQQRLQHRPIIHVGGREQVREWNALALDGHMVFAAWFAPIRRVRAGLIAPPLARTLALSTLARDQSMASRAPKRSSSTRCSRCHTPARCQSRRRRQQVMPLPQPISWGSHSHGIPVCRTKMIPVSAARSGSRGRPPWGLGGSGGNSGATTVQSSSLTIGFAIHPVYHTRRAREFC